LEPAFLKASVQAEGEARLPRPVGRP